MELLLINVIVSDPASPHDQKKVHILISEGTIRKISLSKPPEHKKNCRTIEAKGLHVSPSWVDMHAHFCDPGFEHRENLESGRKAALAGGFGDVALLPETNPPVQYKESIHYIKDDNRKMAVHLHPVGAISIGLDGESLTEMYDLYSAGAIGFSEGNKPLSDAGMLIRAMQYSNAIGAPLFTTPRDINIDEHGQVHEGNIHLELGLKAQPSLSEELFVQRDLAIARYAGSPVHFSKISSRHSLKHIKQAKKEGLPVTAGVSVNNLLFTENDLTTFDTNFKLIPPLREEADRKALIKALKDGTLDVIVSDHYPVESEYKICDFEEASYGAIGIQTLYPLALKALNNDHHTLIKALAINPRSILKMKAASVNENTPACLTLFNPEHSWSLNEESNQSRSQNSPVWNMTLKGKACGVIHENQFFLSNEM